MNLLAVANFQIHRLATFIGIAPGDLLLALALPPYKGRIGTGLPMTAAAEQQRGKQDEQAFHRFSLLGCVGSGAFLSVGGGSSGWVAGDRKSTRLNSSH